MDTSTCLNCNKPIYYGPRTKTRSNDPDRHVVHWRHVDTEHHKCSGRIPVATPIMERDSVG